MGAEQSTSSPTEFEEEVVEETGKPPSALVICGPSGVGKGTLIELLLEDSDGFGFCVSHTTRKPRGTETDGVEYNFIERDEFERGIEENVFLEHAKVHDHYYGTSREAVEKVLDAGACCILDIDVQGARQVRKSGIRAVFVFVAPPSEEELEKRLRGRGTDGEEQIFLRLKAARTEMQSMSEMGLFDFCIVNSDLSQAYAELRMIAMKAKNGLLPEVPVNGTLSPIKAQQKSETQNGFHLGGMEKWKEKIALVTQAGSPSGTEICTALCRAGMRVLAVGRSREDLQKLKGIVVGCGNLAQNFLPVVCDTTKEEEVLSLRKIAQKRWPEAASIHILINISSHVRENACLIDGSSAAWVEMLNTNVLGTLMCSREVIKAMSDRKTHGYIFNVAVTDTDTAPSSTALCRATTQALQSLSHDLRNEMKERGYDMKVVCVTSEGVVSGVSVTKAVVSVLSSNLDADYVKL